MPTLPIAAVKDDFEDALGEIITFLPKLLVFFLILIIGYFVAKAVKLAITKALQGAGLDKALHSGQSGQMVEKVSPGASPSSLVGTVVYYLIILAALGIAITQIGGTAAENFIGSIVAYLPNVIVAILIFVLAGAVAAAVGGLVARTMGDTPTGKVVGSVVPILIMAIATFMILDQLKIAEDIVRITYQALMFSLALGLALAFGLGGRELAADALRSAKQKGEEQKGQVKQDLQKGKQKAQEDAQAVKEKGQEKAQEKGLDSGQGGGGSQAPTQVTPPPAVPPAGSPPPVPPSGNVQ